MKLTEGLPECIEVRWYQALLGAMAGHADIMSTQVLRLREIEPDCVIPQVYDIPSTRRTLCQAKPQSRFRAPHLTPRRRRK